jgi:hypothetical protein
MQSPAPLSGMALGGERRATNDERAALRTALAALVVVSTRDSEALPIRVRCESLLAHVDVRRGQSRPHHSLKLGHSLAVIRHRL